MKREEPAEVRQARVEEDKHPYERVYRAFSDARALAESGAVVIRGRDRPWQQSRQGKSKYFIHLDSRDVAVSDWYLFAKNIRTHSGRHTHQGGLVIYVTHGRGYSMIDGVRYDWKEGDLMILPVKPGGVDHQHFNADDSEYVEWVAFVYMPFMRATGSRMEQGAEQKDWRLEAELEAALGAPTSVRDAP